MATYDIVLRITDVTQVNASTEEEAIEIARDIFTESGYDLSRGHELDVARVDKELMRQGV